MPEFNLKNATDYIPLTRDNVLSKINEVHVFRTYFESPIDFKKTYCNPLRNDKTPGCRFMVGKNDRLLFVDFAKNKLYDLFEFVAEKYSTNFYGALAVINRDFNLKLGRSYEHHYYPLLTSPDFEQELDKSENSILIKKQPWTPSDRAYWGMFGISLETLDKFKVYSTAVVFKNFKPIWRYSQGNPIYTYTWDDKRFKKIYRPLENKKEFKWLSTKGISNMFQGYEQLPAEADLLIITKSLKDVMCLHEMGYTAIAPNSENYVIDIDFIIHLQDRFERLVTFFDPDPTGKAAALELWNDYSIPFIHMDNGYKDISDMCRIEGEKYANQYFDNLIQGWN